MELTLLFPDARYKFTSGAKSFSEGGHISREKSEVFLWSDNPETVVFSFFFSKPYLYLCWFVKKIGNGFICFF